MSKDALANHDAVSIPDSAAEAWAEVYIDVAERLDAEQQLAADEHLKECSATTSKKEAPACPNT
jgi:hypothetical protein